MSHRLHTILQQQFRLPATASVADLRQAYRQRARQLHPDTACSSMGCTVEDFQKLQAEFDEAQQLLEQQERFREQLARTGGAGRPNPFGGPGLAYDHPAFGSGGYPVPPKRPSTPQAGGLPAVGLPPREVYSLVALTVFASASASFLLTRREQTPPSTQSFVAKSYGSGKAIKDIEEPAVNADGWPLLEPGPWNAAEARLKVADGRKLKASDPSVSYEYADTGNFYADRLKGHIRVYNKEQKVVRDGVEMLPIHAAAQDGDVWFIENCAASSGCRGMLNAGDENQDTPLHHAARKGKMACVCALMRSGVDAALSCNDAKGSLPEDVAREAGHEELAALIARYRRGEVRHQMRHPDGLGTLAEPPAGSGIVYTGVHGSEPLRRAANMAAGCQVVASVSRPSKSEREAPDGYKRSVNMVRGTLQNSEFDLEDVDGQAFARASSTSASSSSSSSEDVFGAVMTPPSDAFAVCALLVYEPPGSVSADAPGHWFAVRRETGDSNRWWRLDPVRGSYRLTTEEMREVMVRYRPFRMVVGPPGLGLQRNAQLARAEREAAKLARERRLAEQQSKLQQRAE
eukprot:TRINITY_DN90513_c0_g1_i1.p1 TRINITY_DN90513_c0_g1~~TRINITY_DN90513_c0_g1_i1.p1  ORF type:complete len:573 (+),score=120.61 TRINITY_DN90513_c0_g1_i1:135-1853(+)